MDKDETVFSNAVIAEHKTCSFCEDKEQTINELIEEIKRLRNRNRILMSVKSQLRRKVDDLRSDSDIKFQALCDSKPWEGENEEENS